MATFGREKIVRITIGLEGSEAYKMGAEFWGLVNSLERKDQSELREKAPTLAAFLSRLDEVRRS